MIVADASWVIALRDPDDVHHSWARAVNDLTLNEPIVVHPVTFAECLVAPAKVDQLDSAARSIRGAFEVSAVDVDAPLRWAELRASTSLRLPDAIVLDTAIVHSASAILTFDVRLADAARRRSIQAPVAGGALE